MSIKYSLLALLAESPMYGAQLRSEFESRTGGTWPLNIGQVYTTLDRLTRDAWVDTDGATDQGSTRYRLTVAGEEALQSWWLAPVDRSQAPRSELTIKLALAVTIPGMNVRRLVGIQRTATLRQIAELTRLQRHTDPAKDLAWSLVLDSLIFTADAEIRWLDHVEQSLMSSPRAATPAVRTDTTDTPNSRAQS